MVHLFSFAPSFPSEGLSRSGLPSRQRSDSTLCGCPILGRLCVPSQAAFRWFFDLRESFSHLRQSVPEVLQALFCLACLRLNIRLWLSPFYACRCVSRRKRDFFHSYRVLILSLQYKAIRANRVSAAVRLNTPPNAGTRAETAWPVGISKFRTLNIRNTVSSRVEPPPPVCVTLISTCYRERAVD